MDTPKIRYPFGDEIPASGKAIEVAKGILWIRLPLPMALDHVNVYALDEGDSWTLIDTGMRWPKAEADWETLLQGPLKDKPVGRVILTHHHPDHVGFHGWFVQQGAELLSTRIAYLMARVLMLDVQDTYPEDQIKFYKSAGICPDLLAKRVKERPFNLSDMAYCLPTSFTVLLEGQTLKMGGRDWTVRIGNGHAAGHATFWSDDVVIAGDQIIPSISSNIGVYPTEPDGNPLKEWLESCEHLKAFTTENQLILPGHKAPFYGGELRLQQLIENHHSVLERMRCVLSSPHSACDLFQVIFKRQISEPEYVFALIEALAHCNYLWHAGEVSRAMDDDGVYQFQLL